MSRAPRPLGSWEAHPERGAHRPFRAAHSARSREVDDDSPRGVVRIVLAPCLAVGCRSARRGSRGARIARDALQVVRCVRPTQHATEVRTHRISVMSNDRVEEEDPRFCPVFSGFSPLSGPHRSGTVVGSDSVAGRIAPPLLMLTDSIYDQINRRATKNRKSTADRSRSHGLSAAPERASEPRSGRERSVLRERRSRSAARSRSFDWATHCSGNGHPPPMGRRRWS